MPFKVKRKKNCIWIGITKENPWKKSFVYCGVGMRLMLVVDIGLSETCNAAESCLSNKFSAARVQHIVCQSRGGC